MRVACVATCFLWRASILTARSNGAPAQKPAGIYGYVLFQDNSPVPSGEERSYLIPDCEVIITDARTGHVVTHTYSNRFGNFKVTLPVGKYMIFPQKEGYTNNWITDKTPVTVSLGFYTKAVASFNNGW